ncbi:NAD(P)H-dependent oxidoreductase [Agarilytica rhodophyticola]|uniref:NAD(P)H-dependent oxidoreductase n=1 Tax=Agarilytica rhodophyticola TaxID=1737490 RepID=UPI000B347E11|nr:NAD(P)H-dependent oxidoreductase [Agarilytica rhodophyticola]
MKILVNVFHPNIEASSVNATWVEVLRKYRDVTLNLQYTNYPNWQFDVVREQRLLSEHELIVFQFPFLWYSMPPLMKKWVDDILTYEWAYGIGGEALKGKSVVLAISTGCSGQSYQAGGENNYSMSEFLKPIQQTVELTQMNYLPPFVFYSALEASQRDIDQSAEDYLAHIVKL